MGSGGEEHDDPGDGSRQGEKALGLLVVTGPRLADSRRVERHHRKCATPQVQGEVPQRCGERVGGVAPPVARRQRMHQQPRLNPPKPLWPERRLGLPAPSALRARRSVGQWSGRELIPGHQAALSVDARSRGYNNGRSDELHGGPMSRQHGPRAPGRTRRPSRSRRWLRHSWGRSKVTLR